MDFVKDQVKRADTAEEKDKWGKVEQNVEDSIKKFRGEKVKFHGDGDGPFQEDEKERDQNEVNQNQLKTNLTETHRLPQWNKFKAPKLSKFAMYCSALLFIFSVLSAALIYKYPNNVNSYVLSVKAPLVKYAKKAASSVFWCQNNKDCPWDKKEDYIPGETQMKDSARDLMGNSKEKAASTVKDSIPDPGLMENLKDKVTLTMKDYAPGLMDNPKEKAASTVKESTPDPSLMENLKDKVTLTMKDYAPGLMDNPTEKAKTIMKDSAPDPDQLDNPTEKAKKTLEDIEPKREIEISMAALLSFLCATGLAIFYFVPY